MFVGAIWRTRGGGGRGRRCASPRIQRVLCSAPRTLYEEAMSSVVVATCALGALLLGYRLYARFLNDRVFQLRDEETMPSVQFKDGVDFVPTKREVLWGHHFASVAGAAPILGPAMAIVWGWLPALVWIVVGVIFMGAAHDFGALVLSVRHDGRSVGDLTERLIGPRSRILFLLVIFFLIWLVGAVFAFAIAGLFVAFPASILPVNLEILVAIFIGVWGYRWNRSLVVPSLAALVGLYAVIFGTSMNILWTPAPGSFFLDIDFWLIALMLYAFIASSLPVWVLLQPRDLINSHQLVVGLLALYAGFFVARPAFHAPAIGPLDDLPTVIPLLFVTIACGAISGFHGLVSSGTTSKQIHRAQDVKPIGYGGMLAEAALAILATLAVATGVMTDGQHVWHAIYVPIVETGKVPGVSDALRGFVSGAASLLVSLGLPTSVGKSIVAVLVISFAATSLDTALRIQRLILAELGRILRIGPLENRWFGGLFAAGSILVLVYADKAAKAKSLWPVFGATNQVLAAITLLLCAIYLKQTNRKTYPYAIPAVAVLLVSFSAMTMQVWRDARAENWPVAAVGALIAGMTAWVAVEALLAWRRAPPRS